MQVSFLRNRYEDRLLHLLGDISRFVNFVHNCDQCANSYVSTSLYHFFSDVVISWCFIVFHASKCCFNFTFKDRMAFYSGLSAGLSGLELSSKSSSMYSTHVFLISSFSNLILPDLLLIALLTALVFLLCIVLSLLYIRECPFFVGFQFLRIDRSCIFLLLLCISFLLSCLFLCICNCLVCICASL